MRSRILLCISLTMMLTALSPQHLTGQNLPQQPPEPPRYRVVNLGTLGGTSSAGIGINNLNWVTGLSNLDGDQTAHAALWFYGLKVDLGTLGGPNSAVNWPVKNDIGEIVGISETADMDPLGERWSCRFGTPATGHICLGFRWRNNVMKPLPTLGGNNGYASAANNQRQVVGWAENTVHDPTCVSPQVLQFEAVVYDLNTHQTNPLPPLPEDSDGAATAINDKGQVVGISGACDKAYGGASAAHAVLWQHGSPVDLGNFGGVLFNTPGAINNRGDIAGWSDLTGDQVFHAFLWTKEHGLQDLGTLPGDTYSLAYGINDEGQVVGQSIDADGNSRAFLWQDGVMADLNSLTAPGSMYLIYANDINDHGRIAGAGCEQCAGETIAFEAVPRHHHDGAGASTGQSQSARKVVLPEEQRRLFQQRRLFGRMDLGR